MSSSTAQKLWAHKESVDKIISDYVQHLSQVQIQVADQLEATEKEKIAQAKELAGRAKKATPEEVRELEDERQMSLIASFKTAMRESTGLSFRTIVKCFRYWDTTLFPAIKKCYAYPDDKSIPPQFSETPLKIGSLLFVHGDYYNALSCMQDVVKLQPDCVEARAAILKWTVYLGEWELVENALSFEKKAEKKGYNSVFTLSEKHRIGGLKLLCQHIVDFVRVHKERARVAAAINTLLEEEEENAKSAPQLTFSSFEFAAFLRHVASYLAKTFNPAKETADSLWCLDNIWQKLECVIRNRLPGIAKDEQRIDFNVPFQKPNVALETCSAVAETFDAMRDYVLEAFNVGMVKEAHQLADLGLKYAQKLGVMGRMQQMMNLLLMVESFVCTRDFTMALPGVRERLRVLMNDCELKSAPSSRSCSPSRKANLSGTAAKMLDAFAEITLAEAPSEPRLHSYSKNCRCEVCFLYQNSSTYYLDYHMSQFFFGNTDDHNMACMERLYKGFLEVREKIIPQQVKLLGKTARPRPPLAMCELFGVCAVRWLRSLELHGHPYLRDSTLDELRTNIMQAVIKFSGYASLRCLCYQLSVRQLVREDQFGGRKTANLTWMVESEDGGPKGWKFSLGSLFHYFRKGDSRDSLASKLENSVDRSDSPTSSEEGEQPQPQEEKPDASTYVREAMKEYEEYKHVLYRDWRYPLTTFVGRLSAHPFEAAMMWTESTLLCSRQQARMLKNTVRGYSFDNADVFEQCIKRIPRDFSIVQLATDAEGSLHMIKLHREKEPLILPIAPGTKVAKVHDRMKELQKRNDESGSIDSIKDHSRLAKEFWINRRRVESLMKDSVKDVETYLFGSFAPLLLPTQSLTLRGRKLADGLIILSTSANGNKLPVTMAQELVSVVGRIEVQQWGKLISALGSFLRLDILKVKALKQEYMSLRKKASAPGVINKETPLYTFFIVCPELASFPFEAMEIFAGCPFVGRLVSIHALMGILKAAPQMPRQVEVENAYYILDPDNNLSGTQKRMLEFINKYPWKGIVGSAPKPKELQEILKEKDMFFYFGHGSGSKHMQRRVVKESSCNAVAVLMGCGSVHLEHEGWGMEGRCAVHDYTIANCPAVVGCLWMVTDGEIDRFFMALVELCFSADANTTLDEGAPRLRVLMEAMQKARARVKLPYLTGAAVVSYGIPIVSSE